MTDETKPALPVALAPVRLAGKVYTTGAEIDPELLSDQRLERLIAKGRVAFPEVAETPGAETNRAEIGGREAFSAPEVKSADKTASQTVGQPPADDTGGAGKPK